MDINTRVIIAAKKLLENLGCENITIFEFEVPVVGFVDDGCINFALITIGDESLQDKFHIDDTEYILGDPEVIDWILSLDVTSPIKWNLIDFNIINGNKAIVRFTRNMEVTNG